MSPFKERIHKEFSGLRDLSSETRLSGHWTRLWFGGNESPELATTFYYLAEEFIRGNHTDLNNPLRWDDIILNLIGNPDFDPTLPNVFKWDSIASRIPGDFPGYVDDLRAIVFFLDQAWLIAR